MIKLKNILQERKVLSVFDFDDTLAKADAWIYVQKGGRTIKKLDPAEFAVYDAAPGEEFDFRDFDRKLQNPRVIKQNIELLKKQLDKARRSAKGSRKVTILTARRLGQPVTSFLKSIGINAYVVPVGSSDPKVKADWIEKQIRKGYDTVYFMDDSPKNTKAVQKMLRRYPKVQSIVKLIKEDLPTKLKDLVSTVNINDTELDTNFADHHGLFDGGGAASTAAGVDLDTLDTADDLGPGFEAVGGADETEIDDELNQQAGLPVESRTSLKSIMKELDYPKNKYIEPSSSDKEQLKQTLFNLIQTAYAPIGGHLKFKSPDDIKDPDLKYWKMADIDDDPEIDVVYFGKKTPFGVKHTGMGHDGEKSNIKNLLIKKSAELKRPGNYVEVSKGAFDSFVGKGNVPIIDDEEVVRKVLGDRRSKETTWHGKHPKGTYPGNGWYTRKIGGKEVAKTMIGKI